MKRLLVLAFAFFSLVTSWGEVLKVPEVDLVLDVPNSESWTGRTSGGLELSQGVEVLVGKDGKGKMFVLTVKYRRSPEEDVLGLTNSEKADLKTAGTVIVTSSECQIAGSPGIQYRLRSETASGKSVGCIRVCHMGKLRVWMGCTNYESEVWPDVDAELKSILDSVRRR